MATLWSLRLMLSLICTVISQSPPEIIDKVVQKLWLSNSLTCSMYEYNYGGAILFDAMYKATNQFSPSKTNHNTSTILDYQPLLSPILNEYLYKDITSPGYRITHKEIIPFYGPEEMAIGDKIGLFPIAYIDQLLYTYVKNGDKSIFNFTGKYSVEWQLIFTTADHYILQFPRRLSDTYGTISRDTSGSWKHQSNTNASFVWADDNFMALTLLTRLIQILDFCDKYLAHCNGIDVRNNITTYIDFVYHQHMGFAAHLMYPGSDNIGLYAHGYNSHDGDHSCCAWGRANAWIMASHMEAIKMYQFLDDERYNTQYHDIVKLFRDQVERIVGLQDTETGQWHQVVNDTSTFFEASCSAGFFSNIIQGVLMGVLSMDKYEHNIELGWKGLLKFIDLDTGIIKGACCGTAIQDTVKQYEDRSCDYCRIGNPGDAAFVINALNSYQQYLNRPNHPPVLS
eukprot:33251_1